jgi:hypothetical protein
MRPKRKWMHIDRADEVTVAPKAALTARPISAFGLMLVPTSGTPAGGSSFGAGRARDAGVLGFMGQVVNVFAVFPQGHALVVVPPAVLGAYAVRVADEERPYLVFYTKVDDLARSFVPEIAHAPLGPSARLVLRALQLLPAPGVFLAPALRLFELPELPVSLPFEAADAAPGHDQRLARTRGDGGEVDFPEINTRLSGARDRFRLGNFHADVQLEAPVPDERAGPGVVRKRDGQDKRQSPLPHRQEHTSFLLADGLGGPVDGVEALHVPGILHAHLRVFFAQCARGLDVGEEGVNHHLHRLAVQAVAPFGRPLQHIPPWPRRMGQPGIFVRLHAEVPHAGRFLLRRFEATEERGRKMGQVIHAHCFHMTRFFLSTPNAVISRSGSKQSGSLSSRPLNGTGLPAPVVKPNENILQVVEASAAHAIQIDTIGRAQAIYVDGQWVSSNRFSHHWVYSGRSELIYQKDGVVFWIVGDQCNGIGKDALLKIAQSLEVVNIGHFRYIEVETTDAVQLVDDSSGLFTGDIIAAFPDDGDGSPDLIHVVPDQVPQEKPIQKLGMHPS